MTFMPKLNQAGTAYEPFPWEYQVETAPDSSAGGRLVLEALRSGQSAAITLVSDSTGVNTDLTTAPRRWFRRLVERIEADLPGVHVMYRAWEPVNQRLGSWLTMQEGPLGQRHCVFTGSAGAANRTRTQTASVVGDFTGDIDFRILLAPDTWTPASTQTFLARQSGVGSRGWMWRIASNGDVTFTWHTSPGSEATIVLTAAAASVGGTNGQAQYLRVTVDIDNGAGGYTATMFKSPATDGVVTWTQIAQSVTSGGATTIANPSGVNYEIGGRGAQTEILAGKIFEVQLRNGINGPVMNPQPVETWFTTNACVNGGSPTLYVVNSAEAGKEITWVSDAARHPQMLHNYGAPHLVVLNMGHNENLKRGATLLADYDTWLTLSRARSPMAVFAACTQNMQKGANAPNANSRTAEIGAWARRNGMDVFNLAAPIAQVPNWQTALMADDVHPNEAGYTLSGDSVYERNFKIYR